jgi:alpha-N-acetylglucosaminidase
VEWPLEKGITGPGVYEVTFQYEKGKSRLEMHGVEIVQDGKVLAVDKHFGFTGAGTQNNVYRVELKNLSKAPLTLRAAISTDWGPDSHGRITLEKVQAP